MPLKTALAFLYGVAVRLRGQGYRRGLFKRHQLSRPVISVGNLTLGGTGKTPYVAYLARLLQTAQFQPAILSRGYRGTAERSGTLVSDGKDILCDVMKAGDEPYLLARVLPGVPVAVGRDRFRSGRLIEQMLAQPIHILDDGYQHLALKRNLNILLLDGSDPFGGNHLLPAGRLREPLEALSRADLIVVTRSHLPVDVDHIEITVRRFNRIVPIAYFYHDAVRVWDLSDGSRYDLRHFLGRKMLALAAIGHPKIFLHDLAHYQIQVTATRLFRDHHNFTQLELDGALRDATEAGGDGIITTEKDAVRLERLAFRPGQIFVFSIEAKPEEPEGYRRFLLSEIENLPTPH